MWARIDDNFYLHPKNALMDRDEQDLFLAGNVYCNGQLTDGFILEGKLVQLMTWAKIKPNHRSKPEAFAQAIASRLVDHGYWVRVADGYMVHDFLDWNPSREEVLKLSESRSEAGRRGGLRSGATRRARAEANEAKAQANPKQLLEQNRSKTPSKPEAKVKPEPVNRLVSINSPISGETNQPAEPQNGQSYPQPAEEALAGEQLWSYRLLTDGDVGVFPRSAFEIARRCEFLEVLAQTLTWLRQMRSHEVSGPGALVTRCTQRFAADDLPDDVCHNPLLLRATGLSELDAKRRFGRNYLPAGYENLIEH